MRRETTVQVTRHLRYAAEALPAATARPPWPISAQDRSRTSRSSTADREAPSGGGALASPPAMAGTGGALRCRRGAARGPLLPAAAALCLVVSAAAYGQQRAAGALTAGQILAQAEDVLKPDISVSDVEMTIRRPGKADRSYKLRVMFAGEDHVLVVFRHPPRAKGQAILRLGSELWLHSPKSSRSLRISQRQSFLGGDFSNFDMFAPRLERDYAAKLEGEEVVDGHACYRLLLTSKAKDVPYSSIHYWIRKSDFWPIKRAYNTRNHKAFKTLRFASRGSTVRPDHFVMTNIFEKGKVSEVTKTEVCTTAAAAAAAAAAAQRREAPRGRPHKRRVPRR